MASPVLRATRNPSLASISFASYQPLLHSPPTTAPAPAPAPVPTPLHFSAFQMSSMHSNPAQQELAAAIATTATADVYDSDSSDSLSPDPQQPNDEFFDANDVFYDSNGKRISMRYSLAVYSHDRNSLKPKQASSDRDTLREEPDEANARAQRPRRTTRVNVQDDNLSIAQGMCIHVCIHGWMCCSLFFFRFFGLNASCQLDWYSAIIKASV